MAFPNSLPKFPTKTCYTLHSTICMTNASVQLTTCLAKPKVTEERQDSSGQHGVNITLVYATKLVMQHHAVFKVFFMLSSENEEKNEYRIQNIEFIKIL
jgi:hypothetical protein